MSLGVSSSFSRANKARKLVTPGHLLGEVVMQTLSSAEYRRLHLLDATKWPPEKASTSDAAVKL